MTDPTPARIGFAAPLTGDQAIVGVPMRQCAELAVEEINARESAPFRWKLVAEDDRADPRVAVDVARRFVDDPAVIGVVGHKNSGPSEAAAPIYAEAGLAQMTPSSTNPALSRKGYRTFFRLCAHDTRQGEEAARFAVRSLKVATVIVIHDGTSYGKPLAEVTRDTFLAEGANVVLFKGIVPGERRYPETVACIRDLRPELVYFALTEIESSILARELRAANVDAALFGTDGSRQSQFLPLAGEAAEGAYQTYAGVDPESAPTAQNFVESFNARYGPAPVYGAEVYDATRVLIDAAERADRLDRSHVLGEVTGGRFEGITGTIRFDASGERRDAAVSVWQVREGQMELVLVGLARDLAAGWRGPPEERPRSLCRSGFFLPSRLVTLRQSSPVWSCSSSWAEGSMSARVQGEVYRTRDTKLNRQVALKILPEAFASDPDRLARLPAGSASSRQLQSSWHHRDLSKGSCGR